MTGFFFLSYFILKKSSVKIPIYRNSLLKSAHDFYYSLVIMAFIGIAIANIATVILFSFILRIDRVLRTFTTYFSFRYCQIRAWKIWFIPFVCAVRLLLFLFFLSWALHACTLNMNEMRSDSIAIYKWNESWEKKTRMQREQTEFYLVFGI